MAITIHLVTLFETVGTVVDVKLNGMYANERVTVTGCEW
jgi:hypothetical protein